MIAISLVMQIQPQYVPVQEAVPEVDHSALVSGLLTDPQTGVAIARLSGELLYANKPAVRIFLGEDAAVESVVGRSLWGLFPDDWMRERAEFGASIIRSGQPAMVRSVWRGRQVVSWVTPLDADAAPAEARLLVISRYCTDTVLNGEDGGAPYAVFDSKFIRLGELDILSPRELEVIALVGQGLSIKEIAAMLHRSEKTIQNHRDSIGSKLGLANRVHVAAIARRAGLTPDDARKTRV